MKSLPASFTQNLAAPIQQSPGQQALTGYSEKGVANRVPSKVTFIIQEFGFYLGRVRRTILR